MKRAIISAVIVIAGLCTSAVAQQPAANVQPKATPVNRLAFSRDGRSLAVAYGESNALLIWDVAGRTPVYTAREKAPIRSLAFSPTADLLAIGAGTSAKLLDPKIDRVVRELDGNQGPVRTVSFFADGKRLATGGGDGSVKLWNLNTGDVQQSFTGPKGSILDVAISHDGKWLAAACGNMDTVYLWSLEQPVQKPRKLDLEARRGSPGDPGRPTDVPQVVFSPDSRFLAAMHWEQGRLTSSMWPQASSYSRSRASTTAGSVLRCRQTASGWPLWQTTNGRSRLVRFEQSSGDEQDRQYCDVDRAVPRRRLREARSGQPAIGGAGTDDRRAASRPSRFAGRRGPRPLPPTGRADSRSRIRQEARRPRGGADTGRLLARRQASGQRRFRGSRQAVDDPRRHRGGNALT